MNRIAPYAKSLVAALVAGLGSLYQALDGDQSVTAQEWIAVAMTTLIETHATTTLRRQGRYRGRPGAARLAEAVREQQGGSAGRMNGFHGQLQAVGGKHG